MRVCNVRLPSTLKMVMGLLVTAAVFQLRILKAGHSHHVDQQAAKGDSVLPRGPRNNAVPTGIIAAAQPQGVTQDGIHAEAPAPAQPVLRRADAQSLVRAQVYVFWDKLNTWYLADVEGYDSDRKLHSLRYADGFVEHIALDQAQYKLLSHVDEIVGKPVLPARDHGEVQDGHGEAGTDAVVAAEPEPDPPAVGAVSVPDEHQAGRLDQADQEETDPDGAFNLDYAEAYSKNGAVEYAPNPDIAAAGSSQPPSEPAASQPNTPDNLAAASEEEEKVGDSADAKDANGHDEYAEAYGAESAGRSFLRKPPPKPDPPAVVVAGHSA